MRTAKRGPEDDDTSTPPLSPHDKRPDLQSTPTRSGSKAKIRKGRHKEDKSEKITLGDRKDDKKAHSTRSQVLGTTDSTSVPQFAQEKLKTMSRLKSSEDTRGDSMIPVLVAASFKTPNKSLLAASGNALSDTSSATTVKPYTSIENTVDIVPILPNTDSGFEKDGQQTQSISTTTDNPLAISNTQSTGLNDMPSDKTSQPSDSSKHGNSTTNSSFLFQDSIENTLTSTHVIPPSSLKRHLDLTNKIPLYAGTSKDATDYSITNPYQKPRSSSRYGLSLNQNPQMKEAPKKNTLNANLVCKALVLYQSIQKDLN